MVMWVCHNSDAQPQAAPQLCVPGGSIVPKERRDRINIFAGYAIPVLIFIAVACYIFAALGLFSFGVVALPCVLLGKTGLVTVISDLAPAPLLLISGGILLAGLGLSLGIIPLCSASYGAYKRLRRSAAARRERTVYEEDKTS